MYIMKQEHITLDCCDSIEVHQELLNIVNEKLPPEEENGPECLETARELPEE